MPPPAPGIQRIRSPSGVLHADLARSILIPAVIALLLAAMLRCRPTGCTGSCTYPGAWHVPSVFGILVVLALIVPVGFGLPIPKLLQGLPTTPELQEGAYGKFPHPTEEGDQAPYLSTRITSLKKLAESKAVDYIKEALEAR